jgi:hypothetical protein
MKNTKLSLQDLIESKVDTLKEDEFDQRAGYEYKIKIGDNRYKLDGNGNEILNPSDELLAQMQNDISTRLSPKFNEYRLEFDEDEGAPEENVVAFQVPLSSIISFFATTIFTDEG